MAVVFDKVEGISLVDDLNEIVTAVKDCQIEITEKEQVTIAKSCLEFDQTNWDNVISAGSNGMVRRLRSILINITTAVFLNGHTTSALYFVDHEVNNE